MTTKKRPVKERIARIQFPAVKAIKKEMQERPDLENKLRHDLPGTLKAEGIRIDDAFKEELIKEWRAGIKADVRRAVADNPKSSNWYLKRIVEGKPLKIHVKVNRKTGKVTKTLVGGT